MTELQIKKQIYDTDGYSTDLFLSEQELEILRSLVQDQYFDVLYDHRPDLIDRFKKVGIDNYHTLSYMVDHSKIWNKLSRCLSQNSCDQIKNLPFWTKLNEVFGPFKTGEVVYERNVESGRDEMYWRIVRPESPNDVGTLHADGWFHKTMKVRDRCFPEGSHALKVWIPLYVEPGKNGLAIVENSHKQNWDYRAEDIENTMKPRLNCDESKIPKTLLETPPGNLVIFNEDLVHVGAVNKGEMTRISLEITMIKSHC